MLTRYIPTTEIQEEIKGFPLQACVKSWTRMLGIADEDLKTVLYSSDAQCFYNDLIKFEILYFYRDRKTDYLTMVEDSQLILKLREHALDTLEYNKEKDIEM